ncbi:DUF6531 domain-containing protein, partial [Serratia fonticola]|uniref:DUF6531 domain-containing protein n=1 Tax=Serratia fonticola TaxID=47917 RepID=UPI0021BAA430
MAKIFKTPKDARAAKEATGLVSDVKTLVSMATEPDGHTARIKPVVATKIDPQKQVPVQQDLLGKIEHNTSSEVNYDKAVNTTKFDNAVPNDNASAVTPNGKPAQPIGETPQHGDPVSLFSGEELLTLTDFTLPGVLPFAWRRLYRTSAVEQRCG